MQIQPTEWMQKAGVTKVERASLDDLLSPVTNNQQ
jgi:hypothetical protein